MNERLPGPGRTTLLGRGNECALLDALISAIQRGESRSLVLRGEAGIGKTALLDYLVESASELTVVRAAGRGVRDGAGLREPASAVRPDARSPGAASGPQRQALEIVFG